MKVYFTFMRVFLYYFFVKPINNKDSGIKIIISAFKLKKNKFKMRKK